MQMQMQIRVRMVNSSRETTLPEFSQLPFRFAEIAKVLLDV